MRRSCAGLAGSRGDDVGLNYRVFYVKFTGCQFRARQRRPPLDLPRVMNPISNALLVLAPNTDKLVFSRCSSSCSAIAPNANGTRLSQ